MTSEMSQPKLVFTSHIALNMKAESNICVTSANKVDLCYTKQRNDGFHT